MKTIYVTLLAIVLSAMCCLPGHAQVKYSEGRFTVDADPRGTYKMTVGGNGAYFLLPTQNNFFQIDISAAKTRLAGHGDEIEFYNSATNTYNNIRVKNVYYQSDARAKTNIRNFANGSSVISQLSPVMYQFINGGSDRDEIGLLAQDVESILPEAVLTDENGGKLINYNALIPVLIDAVKSLQEEVAALKAAQ